MTDIACTFWTDLGSPSAGLCRLGLYGGMPGRATCRHCLSVGGPSAKQIANPIDPSVAPPQLARSKGCSGCSRSGKITRWLGVRWLGTPWPKRWKIVAAWPTYVPEPGCGCIVKLKAIVQAWRTGVQIVRKA